MNVDELCEWLKTKLDDQEWKVAEQVTQNQLIKGKNFLNYTLEQWVKVIRLPTGVADSLRRRRTNTVCSSVIHSYVRNDSGIIGTITKSLQFN
jgi:hypothetical protein